MDWANEKFVRIFTRDTDNWRCLSWEARSLLMLLLRKCDRSGVIETKRGPRGLAAIAEMPVDVVDRAAVQLLKDGQMRSHPLGYVFPNFLAAQETGQSDAQRQRRSREMRAAQSDSQLDLMRDNATGVPGTCDEKSLYTDYTDHTDPRADKPHTRARAKKPGTDPRVSPVIAFFSERWQTRFGSVYPGQDHGALGAVVKRLNAEYTVERLETMADEYLATTDPFLLERGLTLASFAKSLPGLVTRKAKPPNGAKKPEHRYDRTPRGGTA